MRFAVHIRNFGAKKAKMLFLQSFLRKGVSLGYVGRNYNLKDQKDLNEPGLTRLVRPNRLRQS